MTTDVPKTRCGIDYDQSCFTVDDHPCPTDHRNLLLTFPKDDKEMKKWAIKMKFKPFLFDPEDGSPETWMVLADRKIVMAFKLAFGGAA